MTLLVLLAAISLGQFRQAEALSPLYPDLREAPPFDYWLDTEYLEDGQLHYVVRFAISTQNWGGELSITSSGVAGNRKLTQVVYNDYASSTIVESFPIGGDTVYHPQHGHFHVTDFAHFLLLKKTGDGVYMPTTKRGAKTTFCVADVVQFSGSGIPGQTSRHSLSTGCGLTGQGLTPGWADTYTSDLYGQWIDNGTSPLTDGDYAIQVVADPLNRIKESNERNNVNVSFFKIVNGGLQTASSPPMCTQKVISPVAVGGKVDVYCRGLALNRDYDLRFGEADAASMAVVSTDDAGQFVASVTMPEASKGVHYIYVTDKTDPSKKFLAPVQTAPSLALSTKSSRVGGSFSAQVRGFASGESVRIVLRRPEATDVTLGTVTANAAGSADISVVTTAAAAGLHKVAAIGQSSGAAVSVNLTISPKVMLSAHTVQSGQSVRISLRGFASGESVSVKINGTAWKTLTVSNVGSAGPSSNSAVIVPALPDGAYTVTAYGATSKKTVNTSLTISAPTPTPVPTSPPTATPTETPVPTNTPATTPTV